MSNFITHNLSRLTTFSGRDTRSQFWPYAGVVFAVSMAALFIVMMVCLAPFTAEMADYALTHPDQATITSGPGHYSVNIHGDDPEFTGPFMDMATLILLATGAMLIFMVLLYAAAVVRRLHDRGLRGWWGLLPLPFAAFALIAMPRLVSISTSPDGPDGSTLVLFGLMAINNMIYNALLVVLIVLLAKRSDPGINRYGPPAGA